jgi:hypothetical protein
VHLFPASADGVAWINGLGGGVLMGLGSLSGILLPPRLDRRWIYGFAAGLNALAILAFLIAERPRVYLAGCIVYLVTNGLCQACYTALLADIRSSSSGDASTIFTLFNSFALFATTYMVWVEGKAYAHFSSRGLLPSEAIGGLVVCAAVMAIFTLRSIPIQRLAPAAAAP